MTPENSTPQNTNPEVATPDVPHSEQFDNVVRPFDKTDLSVMADVQKRDGTPESPATLPEFMPSLDTVPQATVEKSVESSKKKNKLIAFIAGAALVLGGGGVAAKVAVDANNSAGPKPSDPKTPVAVQPSTGPTSETTPGASTGEKNNAEVEALIATMDNEARTNSEAFMQRPLSERLLLRDKYESKVAENAVAWTVHPEHFVVNDNPSIDDDGQTIINNNLIDGLGLARGFVAEPSDANGNKWTQDYTLGESFASTGLVLDANNPHAADLKERLNQTIETIKGLDIDFAPLSEDLVANSTADGKPVEIEGQQCPTKVIEATTTTSTGTSDATVTMAFFKYKDANGKEKGEWVKYSVVNH